MSPPTTADTSTSSTARTPGCTSFGSRERRGRSSKATTNRRRVAGQPIGAAFVDPGNDKQPVLALPQLVPGGYRVRWHVVSVDTHRSEGEHGFAVEQ